MKLIKNNLNKNDGDNFRLLNTTKFYSYDEYYSMMSIPICIGIPNQCFNLIYDTGEMYLIVSMSLSKIFTKSFNISLSQTIIGNTKYYTALNYRNGVMHLREVLDYLFLSEQRPAYTFSFLITWNSTKTYNFEGILGLGYLYPERDNGNYFDSRFNLLDYLKYNKLIKKKIFGHEYSNRTHGTFYIDEIPYSMGDDYFKCKVEPFVPYLTKWHCEMRSIALSTGENFTDIHSPTAFSTGYTDIRGPHNEGFLLFMNIINYSNDNCEIIDFNEKEYVYSKIICNESLNIDNIPDIFFNIKGFQLVLLKEDMFRLVEYNLEKKYVCIIIIDTRYNYWNLGEPVLKNYNMVFDYEDKTVGFRENVNLTGESWFVTIVLICLLMFVCSLGFWIYTNRRRLFMKNIKEKDFDDIKGNEAFNEGKEMEENYESINEQ